jgi:hypothetical protein
MDHGGMIFALVLCAITALTALAGMGLGAWIAYRVKTGGENLYRSAAETEDTVGNIDDISMDMDQEFLRRHPSLVRAMNPESVLDEDVMFEQGVSPIITEQNRRILEQIGVVRGQSAESLGVVLPPGTEVRNAT